jgi:uncharacterized protein YdaU (DUF1376 family)
MAALPYMPLYVADYLADAAHLTTVEHGAYLLLIMTYWQRGEPLPDSDTKLARIVRMTESEWLAIRDDLADFFDVADGVWSHGRIERELGNVRNKSVRAKDAAGKRWKSERNAGAMRMQCERNADAMPAQCHTDTDTDTDTEKKNKKRANAHVIRPDGVDQQVWDDFVAQRKTQRAPITETALRRISLEAEKAGITLGNALEICLQRGWRGFEADWVAKKLTDPQGRISDAALQTMHNLREYL